MESIEFDLPHKTLKLVFPSNVISTNAPKFKAEIMAALSKLEQSGDFDSVLLVFDSTIMIDSLGMNMLLWLVDWCEENQLKLNAQIREPFIQMLLESVWLDQRITIQMLEKTV